MKIPNFNEFLAFADDMITRYKFYRLVDNRIQCFMFGREGLVISSETDKPDNKTIMEIIAKGFIETKLSDAEIQLLGLGVE